MSTYELFLASMKRHAECEEMDFFEQVAIDLGNCNAQDAMMLWYANQRSWFKPEMADEILTNPSIHAQLLTGELSWNSTTKKFEQKAAIAT